MMKYKSSKRKKPGRKPGSWLQTAGIFLTGFAAFLEVAFKVAVYLSDR